jgi:hypothetical protein
MDNRPAWVPKVEAALARGRDAYREAAEIIDAAMEADPSLTQAMVAEHIGHKPPWVSTLLKWHKAGCPPGGVFGPEIAARREKIKDSISTSKSGGLDVGPDRPWLPGIEGGPTDAPPAGEGDATLHALGARAACKTFAKALSGFTREMMLLVYRSVPARRRSTLEKLAADL